MAEHTAPAGPPAGRPDLAPAAERGRTTIADKVVSRVAAIAATEVDAVVGTGQGWTKVLGRTLPHVDAVVAGGTSRISVEVAATWPTPLSRVAVEVRDRVRDRVTELTGTDVTRVDVTVADVVHAPAATRRVA